MKTPLIVLAVAVVALAFFWCNRKTAIPSDFAPQLCFESWTNSQSAYERMLSTNLWIIVESNRFKVRFKKDGKMEQFWANDDGRESIEELRQTFRLSIPFAVQQSLYDALSNFGSH